MSLEENFNNKNRRRQHPEEEDLFDDVEIESEDLFPDEDEDENSPLPEEPCKKEGQEAFPAACDAPSSDTGDGSVLPQGSGPIPDTGGDAGPLDDAASAHGGSLA